MSELLKTIGIFTIGSSLVITVLGYLGRKIIEQLLNKDLEKYKSKLDADNEKAKLKFEKEVESFRADLNLLYSKQIQLYSKKSEIIENLYQKLVDLNNSIITVPLKSKKVL
jgi:predicted PurR-regulated permease PerM